MGRPMSPAPADRSPRHVIAVLDSPVGRLAAVREPDGTLAAEWLAAAAHPRPKGARDAEERALADGLAAALAGTPADFAAVPTPDGPPFHRACWEACRRIPAGETRTYAELAVLAGRPAAAARAAGQAMRSNPLPVAVPCHRVVATGGGLGGYAGSDDPHDRRLDRKRWLLANETRTNAPMETV